MALNTNMLVFAFTIFSLFGSLLSCPPNVMVTTYGTPNVTVATDGSGNFGTISEAISQIPVNRNDPYVVLIKAGTYNEAIYIGQNKSNLVLIGEGMDKTIIQFNNSAKTVRATSDSATVDISANDVLVKGIRFVNYVGPDGGQAVALRLAGDRIALYQCSIQGYQDTLLTAYGIHFFRECDIYGTVDFIFGFAHVVFQNCNIYLRKRSNSGNLLVITAQGRGKVNDTNGIVLHNCTVKADKDLEPYLNQTKAFLGRPWYNCSQTIVMESFLDKLIDPKGWLESDDKKALSTLNYIEYANRGPGANTKGRVQWPGYHIAKNSEEVKPCTVENFINGTIWPPSSGIPFVPGLIGQ